MLINLDHAATTPVREEVLSAMLPFFRTQYANASGSYSAARESRRAMDAARQEVAEAIGAKLSEIYFTSGGTEADNWALTGCVRIGEKKHIVTTKIEHHAVLHTAQALERQGAEVAYLDVDELARVLPETAEKAVCADTAIVSVMLANNEVGTIQPIAEIAGIAHAHGALMHTDAVQAVGHIPVNVDELGVDLLSMSAHKFGGPKGIGALYIRSGVCLENLLYGGAQERSLRAGTENVPAVVGMGKAITLATNQMKEHAARVSQMRDALEERLMALPGVRVNGDLSNRLPGHLHLTIDGISSQMLLLKLDMMGIAASAGSACASGSVERSHVVRAMGIQGDNQADIRFSIGVENTMEDIAAAADAMRRILTKP